MNAPELRFPEFADEYSIKTISDITTRVVNPVSVEAGVEYTQIGIRSHGRGIFHKDKTTSVDIGNKRVFWIEPNLFIVNIVFAWEQAVAVTSDDDVGKIASHRFPMFKAKNNEVTTEYLHRFFLTKRGKHLLGLASPGGAGRNKTLGQKEFEKLKLKLPTTVEQNEVTKFLSAVDKKISLLKQKHEQLVDCKKGIVQQLFSQQLRFKYDDGQDFPNWEYTKFKQHFERVVRKNKSNNLNVLTISGKRGLINQQKYFNKSVSAKDVTGYYQMNKGEFAYNKSYSKGYPMGAIKRLNNYEQGVVSTLYICFKSMNGDDRFWEQYFEAGLLNREIYKIAQEGARNHGLLNVSVKEFFDDIKMYSPCCDEQTKIADFLGAVDKKINLAQQQIEQTQAYKQGLLQQMFV
jgi:type I restriction enzyme S subunit